MRENGYRPIGDYALIGDAHTAALVARDGSIDWCCWPYFDSPAVFCRLLDARRGGHFRVGPAGPHETSREYADSTNILVTTHTTRGARVRVTDFMPVVVLNAAHEGEDIASKRQVLRLVEGLAGEAEMEVEFRPTFDYARGETRVELGGGRATAAGPRGENLCLSAGFGLEGGVSPAGLLRARFAVAEGERRWLMLAYGDATAAGSRPMSAVEAEDDLAGTLRYWREWSGSCTYAGPYRDLVLRSALVLKLLTFEETGALVAAPTTSLPEEVGGVRNWDYRFSWLRDSSLIIYSLQLLGFAEEATDYFRWLERLCIPCRGAPRIMYTIRGDSHLPELVLEHLEGHRGSRPVRVGNAASDQKQLDIYGEVLDAAHLFHERGGRAVGAGLWPTLRLLADEAAARWRETDQGIWEVRGRPRHFLYSKLMCWVALDRAVRLAPPGEGPRAARWAAAGEQIRRAILAEGYDEGVGAFTQAFGSKELDASALTVPLVGFLPATDARVRSTVEAIRARLTSGGLVYRYLAEDGLPGGEGVFLLCSFWMVDNLALCGRADEARALFERITAHANDLGLLAEEVDQGSSELLGNFPQGFTHLGLIRSAFCIAKAEALGAERSARAPSDRAREIERARRAPDTTEPEETDETIASRRDRRRKEV